VTIVPTALRHPARTLRRWSGDEEEGEVRAGLRNPARSLRLRLHDRDMGRGRALLRHPARSLRLRLEDDRGAAAVEAAIVAPFLVALMLLVVFAGRVAEADGSVRRSASEAARAASLRQDPTDAVTAAEDTAAANLATAGVDCDPLRVDVDTADFTAGGTVGVTVICRASIGDVTLLGIPTRRTFTAHEVEVIDRFRSATDAAEDADGSHASVRRAGEG
jgi:Flp pilus assembly protein TadG